MWLSDGFREKPNPSFKKDSIAREDGRKASGIFEGERLVLPSVAVQI
jgi:hypothetical protein